MFQVGSSMYNLNISTSDSDYIAVFASDTAELLGSLNGVCAMQSILFIFTHAASVTESMGNQGQQRAVEHKCYEARLLAECLLKGNPNIVGVLLPTCRMRHHLVTSELLYHHNPAYACDMWRELVAHRQAFVSEVMLRQYLGFTRVRGVASHRIASHRMTSTLGTPLPRQKRQGAGKGWQISLPRVSQAC